MIPLILPVILFFSSSLSLSLQGLCWVTFKFAGLGTRNLELAALLKPNTFKPDHGGRPFSHLTPLTLLREGTLRLHLRVLVRLPRRRDGGGKGRGGRGEGEGGRGGGKGRGEGRNSGARFAQGGDLACFVFATWA